MDFETYLKIFTGLLAIMNPIGVVPLYLNFTDNIKSERPAIARSTALAVFTVLIISMIAGIHILNFFSISIDAFRIAGGILLLMMAFTMLEARRGRTRHTPEEDEEAVDSKSVAVVPLAIPLITGPGAMSSIILFSGQMHGWLEQIILVVICTSLSFIVWGTLFLAPQIGDRFSTTSMNIMTRVMGLILATIAVEFIIGGVKNLLPGLV